MIIIPNLNTALSKFSPLRAFDKTEYIGTMRKAQMVSSIRSNHSICPTTSKLPGLVNDVMSFVITV